jgi:hypothetical protein
MTPPPMNEMVFSKVNNTSFLDWVPGQTVLVASLRATTLRPIALR